MVTVLVINVIKERAGAGTVKSLCPAGSSLNFLMQHDSSLIISNYFQSFPELPPTAKGAKPLYTDFPSSLVGVRPPRREWGPGEPTKSVLTDDSPPHLSDKYFNTGLHDGKRNRAL